MARHLVGSLVFYTQQRSGEQVLTQKIISNIVKRLPLLENEIRKVRFQWGRTAMSADEH